MPKSTKKKPSSKAVAIFVGKVRDLDVVHLGDKRIVQCLAVLTPRHGQEIQVVTEELQLQTNLSFACVLNKEVEVYFNVEETLKRLTRVRILG
jgi:hypothetical protein